MYSKDHEGHYPDTLEEVVPKYLDKIRECPGAEEVTYTYQTGPNAPTNEKGWEDFYFLECHGEHHTNLSLPANYPQYSAEFGLIER